MNLMSLLYLALGAFIIYAVLKGLFKLVVFCRYRRTCNRSDQFPALRKKHKSNGCL